MHSSPMKRWVSFRSAALVLALALPASAYAPSDQYDGFVGEDEEITDNYTKLVWDRNQGEYPATLTFEAARSACAAEDKRLPSLKELLTIVDEAPWFKYTNLRNEPRFIDKNAFESTPKDPFWTSSEVQGATDDVYTVDFSTGFVKDASKGDERRVRCVR